MGAQLQNIKNHQNGPYGKTQEGERELTKLLLCESPRHETKQQLKNTNSGS